MKNNHSTIMIVDDDLDDLFLIQRALRAIGVANPIQPIHSAADAISYARGEGKYSDRDLYPYPTFVITDLRMTPSDGYELLEHFKNNPEWAVIPTAVLTASRDVDDIKKAYMLGASSYHVKPNSHDELQVLLKTLYTFWMTCEVPQVDKSGRQLRTDSTGKLGERFPQRS